ncbi:Hypothetical protein ETEE_1587 [Edwardsiella anguillarum ET080813]|uniref:Uncharacterized protein n=1 Tax=Edwardsiella anguillarum ET080813 TaxID=667120 RepID=A0A076LJD5_9GAMM|nr:Hypothetical protein ETEE_1587 [Edwardsiella anguillarum ET080813]
MVFTFSQSNGKRSRLTEAHTASGVIDSIRYRNNFHESELHYRFISQI